MNSLLLVGLASLMWFIFRTGTKPSRITYPCQKAALANSLPIFGAFLPVSVACSLVNTKKWLSKRSAAVALLSILATAFLVGEPFLGFLQPAQAVNPSQEIKLALASRNATAFPASDIYTVSGRANAHINQLLNLMGSRGLLFYKSSTTGTNRGLNGLVAHNDVVLIKINMQWGQRGGTNTDMQKELIQAIIDHPDGFTGEVVISDNGQGRGNMNWDANNAEDSTQSTQDVVNMFSATHNVSTYSWEPIRGTRVSEYAQGDLNDGYILYDTPDPETGIYVTYPKFRTLFGTYLSFKHGIWNGTGYEKRLKVINMPVLKTNNWLGVTVAVKHYMGVNSEGAFAQGGLGNGHVSVSTGGMGTLMIETGLPTLNIVDAIWVNANAPPSTMGGPQTPYEYATRVNTLVASTDPVAVDYWATKHVLVQTSQLIGYNDTHTLNPDSTNATGLNEDTAFGTWLNLTKNEILSAGYNVTIDENHMNVYACSEIPAGDVDRNGKVNVLDIYLLGKAYGSSPSQPNWNAYCNFNSDDLVDEWDLVAVRENYGKT